MNGNGEVLIRPSAIARGATSNKYSCRVIVRSLFLRYVVLNGSYLVCRVRNFLRNVTSVLIVEDRYRRRVVGRLGVALYLCVRNLFRNNLLSGGQSVSVRSVCLFLNVACRASDGSCTTGTSSRTTCRGRTTSSRCRFGLIFWVLWCNRCFG